MEILVAEDDDLSGRLIRSVLEELGHSVHLSEDGLSAWEAFQLQPCRLLVCDWLMPRMNGLELVRRIRESEITDYTYVIMLTANVGERENYLTAMEAGVDDFLAKPLDRQELEIRLQVAKRILEANSRIQSLESMLTICAYTKRIHFPEEGWQSIETFLKNHLGVSLSHGIDPDYYETTIRPQLELLAAEPPH